MKPVYVINGFLESGKTDFIVFTLSQPYFVEKGVTLLLLCEEGITEYEDDLLKKTDTVLELIEEEKDFTPEHLTELEKKHNPERIIVEYNGMWNFKNMKLPRQWKIEQQITLIDASTFSSYFTNMKSLVAEMVRNSEMVLFNRCDNLAVLNSYKRNVKAVNQRAEIIFEDENGEIDVTIEEDLPYDLNAEVIELRNPGYGIFYLDALEYIDRYIGKKVQFVGMVLKPQEFPNNYFAPGRMAMTCCADDMAFLGFACYYEGMKELEEKQWVMVVAEVKKEYFAPYNGVGPMLHAISVKPTKAPKEEIISFI